MLNGRRTGTALVIFGSPSEAAEAKKSLHHREMGSRYIEVFDHMDDFMQKVCRLGEYSISENPTIGN